MFLRYDWLVSEPIRMNPRFRIVDNDFENYINSPSIVEAVMTIYSARGLQVVPNVFRLWQFRLKNTTSGGRAYSIEHQIDWSKKNNPLHDQYQEEIEKYLILL